jgi:hypothetical protein
MSKTYIATIGTIDEITTEEIPLREIAVNAKDVYEAHKVALFKCNLIEKETVFNIKESTVKTVVFNHKTGFVK